MRRSPRSRSDSHPQVLTISPPPLVGDINFELNRTGFEVWFSERIVRDHEDLIENFTDWLRQQPQVVSVVHDDLKFVMVGGVLSEGLRVNVTAWWASRVDGLIIGR